jgi:hypothetical protein
MDLNVQRGVPKHLGIITETPEAGIALWANFMPVQPSFVAVVLYENFDLTETERANLHRVD